MRISRIAQVDLGIFDHKHKTIGNAPNEGLQRMCIEIFSNVLRGLMEHQAKSLSQAELSNLEVLYRRVGQDRVKQFGLDSYVNQIPYNRHEEELSIQKFASILKPAAIKFLDSPITQQLPCWARVLACEEKLQEDLAQVGMQGVS